MRNKARRVDDAEREAAELADMARRLTAANLLYGWGWGMAVRYEEFYRQVDAGFDPAKAERAKALYLEWYRKELARIFDLGAGWVPEPREPDPIV